MSILGHDTDLAQHYGVPSRYSFFSATWCGTCKRQERVIDAVRASNSSYDESMSFVKVDWGDDSRHGVTASGNIPLRSILLVLRGDQEVGRIVEGTGTAGIKTLIDLGLAGS